MNNSPSYANPRREQVFPPAWGHWALPRSWVPSVGSHVLFLRFIFILFFAFHFYYIFFAFYFLSLHTMPGWKSPGSISPRFLAYYILVVSWNILRDIIYSSVSAETTPFSIFWPGPEILLIIYLVTSVTTLLRILIMKNQERSIF